MSGGEMSFWDHLDELRGTIILALVAVGFFAVLVFCFKSLVFDGLLLAPARSDFFMYRMMGTEFTMNLVNLDISAQFFIHLRVAIVLGFVLAFPYVIYELWKFLAPALYPNEKTAVRKAFLFAGILFYIGIVVGYLLVLPFALNFFQSYSVSDSVANTISLNSYISMFMSLVLVFGIVFEFPAVIAALSQMGIVDRGDLRKGRKYALVAVLILAAIITPADPLSMVIAAAPLYLLYELSIIVCSKEKAKNDLDK